jgi:hypothetical protein
MNVIWGMILRKSASTSVFPFSVLWRVNCACAACAVDVPRAYWDAVPQIRPVLKNVVVKVVERHRRAFSVPKPAGEVFGVSR